MDTDTSAPAAPDNNGDIAKASLRGRLLLAGVVVLATALIAAFQFYAFPLLKAAALKTTAPGTLTMIKWLFVGIAALGAATTLVWIAYAVRILRHRQDPPPGTWLWRDTKIVRGDQAVRRAWLSIVAASLACAVCIGITIYIAIAIDQLAAKIRAPGAPEIIYRKTLPAK